MKKNEHLKQQIKSRYTTEDSESLARSLGITIQYLRVLAKRLHIKKGLRTVTNEVVDGEKLCPKCCKMLKVEAFNKDKYQPNNLDYWCRNCRQKAITKKAKTVTNNSFKKDSNKLISEPMNLKKNYNPIIKVKNASGNMVDGLKCKGRHCQNAEKPLSEFYLDSNNVNGYKNVCIFCIKENNRQSKLKKQQSS